MKLWDRSQKFIKNKLKPEPHLSTASTHTQVAHVENWSDFTDQLFRTLRRLNINKNLLLVCKFCGSSVIKGIPRRNFKFLVCLDRYPIFFCLLACLFISDNWLQKVLKCSLQK